MSRYPDMCRRRRSQQRKCCCKLKAPTKLCCEPEPICRRQSSFGIKNTYECCCCRQYTRRRDIQQWHCNQQSDPSTHPTRCSCRMLHRWHLDIMLSSCTLTPASCTVRTVTGSLVYTQHIYLDIEPCQCHLAINFAIPHPDFWLMSVHLKLCADCRNRLLQRSHSLLGQTLVTFSRLKISHQGLVFLAIKLHCYCLAEVFIMGAETCQAKGA